MNRQVSLRSLLALLSFAPTALAARPCEQLTAFSLPGVTMSAATPVAAGPWLLPNAAPGAAPVDVPAFCRVGAVAWPEVRFEVWLPERWNGKFMGVGNGGMAGSISYSAMLTPLRRQYAVASTDTGHQGSSNDASWATGHMQRVVDFAFRGIHVTTQAAKGITAYYYNTGIAHSYFEGCSQGGQQALMLAQRYPRDYDGIIAGDPANYWTRHYIGGHLWSALAMEGDGYIPPSKLPAIGAAVDAACDALDGVKDGILTDPRRCRFDPATLACKGADSPSCLTEAQVAALRKLYDGPRGPAGNLLYPGLLPGGEAAGGWASWVTGAEPGQSQHARLGIDFFRYVVFEDPNWDFRTFRFSRSDGLDNDVEFTEAKLGAMFNAIDPDLTAFRANKGKLIQYHGWADPDITPLNSINYYESVVRLMGGEADHSLSDTQEFYRLFMVPGMQHCRGGPGPSSFSMLDALERWVEKGVAPDRVIASHITGGKVDRTRPLCPYPMEAQWTGTGSIDVAANFVCALPAAQGPGVTYAPPAGAGNGKYVVLVAGDDEYHSEEALPQLAKILAVRHGFRATVLFTLNAADGTIDRHAQYLPGLDELEKADLLILFTRFRNLPDDQMEHLVKYIDSGRPVMGLRTATHAFRIPAGSTYARYSYDSKIPGWEGGFGRRVLGETWINHHGQHSKQSTRAVAVKEAAASPVLRGIGEREIWVPTDVYKVRLPLPADCRPLLLGEVLAGMTPADAAVAGPVNDPMMPVAWTKDYRGESGKTARVFTTTMGAADDLESEGFRRLLVNAAYWAVGLEGRIPAKANVDYVGEYQPHPLTWRDFVRGVKPADLAIR